MTIFMKLMSEGEDNRGFQYKDGLNTDYNLVTKNGSEGLSFTSPKHVLLYIDTIQKPRYVRVVEPEGKYFEEDGLWQNLKSYRAQKLVLKEKYDLEKLEDLVTLVGLGVDPWAVCNNQYTPLIAASLFGATKIVKNLLHFKVDLDHTTSSKWSALHYASNQGQTEIVKLLLEAGAKLTEKEYVPDPLQLALNRGLLDTAEVLWKPSEKLGKKITRIGECIMHKNFKSIEYLVKKGYPLDKAAKDSGNTSLHYATSWGTPMVIEYLVKAGANINAKTKDGDTPLHNAARHTDEDHYDCLIKLGADTSIKNKKGQTAEDIKQGLSNFRLS